MGMSHRMKTPDLDLDLVRCFLTVAERKGFTAAASRLNLTQSAVSLKIQRLEMLLGKTLFERSSRSIKLTPEGEILSAYGRRLLALNQEVVERISNGSESGELRLGVMQQFGQLSLAALLIDSKQAHPNVKLTIEVGMTGDLLAKLEAGAFDVVIGAAGRATGADVKEERLLLQGRVVWTQAVKSKLDLTRDPLPLVLFPEPCGYRRLALERLEEAGRSWRVAYTSTSVDSIQAAVQADIGISAFSEHSVCAGLRSVDQSAALPLLPDLKVALYQNRSLPGATVAGLRELIARSL